MRLSFAVTLLAGLAAAKPFSFPLKNGFPAPDKFHVSLLQKNAGGSLPNSPLPTKLKPNGITTLQLIALNEIFEVAFFTELYRNITDGKPGFNNLGSYAMDAEAVVHSIRAQEELHALGANAILEKIGEEPIKPCKYDFPVSNFEEAIALAATFTDVVLGTLPVAQTIFAEDAGQETGLIKLIGSVLAQEGEQTGVYRLLQKKVPSAAPFLTGGSPDFAFTAIQSFIVPGSCPNIKNIKLKTFKSLTAMGTPKKTSKMLKFEAEGALSASKNSLVYISGQNLPVTVPIKNVATKSGMSTFEAEFPFESESFARGLTIAAVVSGTGKKFSDPDAVAAKTVNGPGLIEVA